MADGNGAPCQPLCPGAMPAAAPAGGVEMQAAEEGRWCAPPLAGDRRPAARYEHAVAVVDGRMYVCGGNSGSSAPSTLAVQLHMPGDDSSQSSEPFFDLSCALRSAMHAESSAVADARGMCGTAR